MKKQTLLKTITVAGAVAATMSLSACDMHISFGQKNPSQEQEQNQGQEQQDENEGETVAQEETESTSSDSATSSDSTSSDSSTDGTSSDSTTSSGGSTDSDSSTSASDSDSSSSSSSSSSGSDDGYQGPRIGEEGVELDEDGTGKIPADVLEEDIVHAYKKQGTTVDDVDCYSDLRIYGHRGSQSCTVTAMGKKHYGTVKVTSATQSGIYYSLEFPQI
jgi:DNA mismatch repair ATPase MutL